MKHTVRFSVAFLNKAAGFYSNHHPVANDYFNNTGYGNHPNFDMRGIDSLSAAQVTITDASGASRTLNVPASSGWTGRELPNIPMSAGTATVTIRASSGNGYLFIDDLTLVRTSG